VVTYRSRVGSPVEVFSIVADNLNSAIELGDCTHVAALGVAFGLGNGLLEVLSSEPRQPRSLNPGNPVGLKRGRTVVLDCDASTSETVVITGRGHQTQRVVLDNDHGQRLVLDVDPGESIGVRFDPGEKVVLHNNFRRP
jgi:hypothetical protein